MGWNKKTEPVENFPWLVYANEPGIVSGGDGGGSVKVYYFGSDPTSVYCEPGSVSVTLEDDTLGDEACKSAKLPIGHTVVFVLGSEPSAVYGNWVSDEDVAVGVSTWNDGADHQAWATVPAEDFVFVVE